jgi:hypothetical protein
MSKKLANEFLSPDGGWGVLFGFQVLGAFAFLRTLINCSPDLAATSEFIAQHVTGPCAPPNDGPLEHFGNSGVGDYPDLLGPANGWSTETVNSGK